MKEWKIKQQMYHMLHQGKYDDDLNEVEIVMTDNVVEDAVRHFNEYVDQWIYPSKSFVVAICYAYWISEDFHEDFYELLNDVELLAGNDPYFAVYDDYKYIYDRIISEVLPLKMKGMVPDIRKYYEEEIRN
jgi:hypothetical protein